MPKSLDFFHNVCYNGKMRAFSAIEPKKCWVGDQQKVCYDSREEAEAAALIAEHDYGAPKLSVYKCEYGDHWHLSSHRAG